VLKSVILFTLHHCKGRKLGLADLRPAEKRKTSEELPAATFMYVKETGAPEALVWRSEGCPV